MLPDCRRLLDQRLTDTWPQCRTISVITQFRPCEAKSLPGAKFFGTRRTCYRMSLERGPFRRRAVLENSIPIFANHIHHFHRAPVASLARGGSSICRRFFFA